MYLPRIPVLIDPSQRCRRSSGGSTTFLKMSTHKSTTVFCIFQLYGYQVTRAHIEMEKHALAKTVAMWNS